MTTIVVDEEVVLREIQLRDAKAPLSALIDGVRGGEPAIITRHGKREAVVISFEEWQILSRFPPFGRLLMAAPLEAGDLPDRDPAPPRDSGL